MILVYLVKGFSTSLDKVVVQDAEHVNAERRHGELYRIGAQIVNWQGLSLNMVVSHFGHTSSNAMAQVVEIHYVSGQQSG